MEKSLKIPDWAIGLGLPDHHSLGPLSLCSPRLSPGRWAKPCSSGRSEVGGGICLRSPSSSPASWAEAVGRPPHTRPVCLGCMQLHNSPWESTQSSISENKRAVFNLCRSKGQPGGLKCWNREGLITLEISIEQPKIIEIWLGKCKGRKGTNIYGAWLPLLPLLPNLTPLPQPGHCQLLTSTNLLSSPTASPLPATLSSTRSPGKSAVLRGNSVLVVEMFAIFS